MHIPLGEFLFIFLLVSMKWFSKNILFSHRFDHIKVEDVKACGNTYKVNYFGDYSSDAEFFVASGVLAMFYAMASLAFYCFMDAQYQENKTFPLVVRKLKNESLQVYA